MKPAVIEVNCQLFWPMPEQLLTTPPPGQGRSRLTDQKASRARWCDVRPVADLGPVAGVVSLLLVGQAVHAGDADVGVGRGVVPAEGGLQRGLQPLGGVDGVPYMSEPPPKSNGMMVKTSMSAPSDCGLLDQPVAE